MGNQEREKAENQAQPIRHPTVIDADRLIPVKAGVLQAVAQYIQTNPSPNVPVSEAIKILAELQAATGLALDQKRG
jgi:hypothetical protein